MKARPWMACLHPRSRQKRGSNRAVRGVARRAECKSMAAALQGGGVVEKAGPHIGIFISSLGLRCREHVQHAVRDAAEGHRLGSRGRGRDAVILLDRVECVSDGAFRPKCPPMGYQSQQPISPRRRRAAYKESRRGEGGRNDGQGGRGCPTCAIDRAAKLRRKMAMAKGADRAILPSTNRFCFSAATPHH